MPISKNLLIIKLLPSSCLQFASFIKRFITVYLFILLFVWKEFHMYLCPLLNYPKRRGGDTIKWMKLILLTWFQMTFDGGTYIHMKLLPFVCLLLVLTKTQVSRHLGLGIHFLYIIEQEKVWTSRNSMKKIENVWNSNVDALYIMGKQGKKV